MITSADSFTTYDLESYYAILPSDGRTKAKYERQGKKLDPVPEGFAYNSGTNPQFLTVQQIRDAIKQNVDSAFTPF